MMPPHNIDPIAAELALDWVDNLLYTKAGCRLNDLERQIFLGSWCGQTYEESYPANPQYVEKSAGYKLWRKLSAVLAEKVSKKRIQGAITRHMRADLERSTTTPAPPLENADDWQVQITHHASNPKMALVAQDLKVLLGARGRRVSVAPAPAESTDRLRAALTELKDWILITELLE